MKSIPSRPCTVHSIAARSGETLPRAKYSNAHMVPSRRAGRASFAASGRGILWAVLNSGVNRDRPHFNLCFCILEAWDFAIGMDQPEQPFGPGTRTPNPSQNCDFDCHGTHVSGISPWLRFLTYLPGTSRTLATGNTRLCSRRERRREQRTNSRQRHRRLHNCPSVTRQIWKPASQSEP